MFEFMVIGGKRIKEILEKDYTRVINLIEDAYCLHDNNKTINPDTYFLRFPEKPNARIAALPAYIGGNIDRAGIKWIASFPDNIKNNIPRASAILILNDFSTGYPIACLESSIISASRTAASAVLGATKLNHGQKTVDAIAMIGNGIIAKYILEYFIGCGWHFNKIYLYDLDTSYSEDLAAYIRSKYCVSINILPTLTETCRASDLIVFATTSAVPYVNDKEMVSHNPIILNISLRDLHPDIIIESFNIVDDIEHSLKAETSLHLTAKLHGHHNFIYGTIGEILNDKISIPQNVLKIYSPFGMGMLDVALGNYIYEQVKQEGEGECITDFFYDQARKYL